MLDSYNQSSIVGGGVTGKKGRRRNADGEREMADKLLFLEGNALSRRKQSGVEKNLSIVNFSILCINV